MAERRRLKLAGIDAIMPEVGRLTAGHSTVGGWTLAQICDHLTKSIILSLEPPPAKQFRQMRASVVNLATTERINESY